MEVLGGASTVVGLANPIFQSAKVLRDRIKLVASEKAELLAVLSEYEKEITHLASLYNDHSALLEQHSLRTDLVEIANILCKLSNSISSAHPVFSRRKVPTVNDLWRAGDVREMLAAENAAIGRIRSRWQMRVQACTLASMVAINARLERQESGLTEIKAMLGQVIQTMSMLQQGHVQEPVRSLSVHSQVEPAGFESQRTPAPQRVGFF